MSFIYMYVISDYILGENNSYLVTILITVPLITVVAVVSFVIWKLKRLVNFIKTQFFI